MKVKELIKKLKKCNPNLLVYIDLGEVWDDVDRVFKSKDTDGNEIICLTDNYNTVNPIIEEIK